MLNVNKMVLQDVCEKFNGAEQYIKVNESRYKQCVTPHF